MHSITLFNNLGYVSNNLNISFMKEGVDNTSKHDAPAEEKRCDVTCYSNFDLIKSSYNFESNGFEYFRLDGDLLDRVNFFEKYPNEERAEMSLLKEGVKYMSLWGKKKLPGCNIVVPLDILYRDNSPFNSTSEKPFFLAHVDFDKENLQNNMKILKGLWKPYIETALGDLSDEQYFDLKIVQIVNIWLSLDRGKVNNTLALLDTSSIDLQKDLRPLKNNKLNSISISQNPKQNWVALQGMTMGQGIIFNSFITPHTAIELPRDSNAKFYRKSVELRFAFLS